MQATWKHPDTTINVKNQCKESWEFQNEKRSRNLHKKIPIRCCDLVNYSWQIEMICQSYLPPDPILLGHTQFFFTLHSIIFCKPGCHAYHLILLKLCARLTPDTNPSWVWIYVNNADRYINYNRELFWQTEGLNH